MNKTKSNLMDRSARIRRLTAVALFCALAYICVFLIRFKVMFLTFDLKDAVMAIGAMYFGPVSAFVMTALVSLIEFLTISDTGVYGLVMNFLSSVSFCVVASLIYKFRKSLFGAVLALVCGTASMVAVMMMANLLITPYYMTSIGNSMNISDIAKMIPGTLLPFNLIKGIVNSSVVMLLYKPFSTALKSSGVIRISGPVSDVKPSVKNRIIVAAISATVLAAALTVLFLVFNATLA